MGSRVFPACLTIIAPIVQSVNTRVNVESLDLNCSPDRFIELDHCALYACLVGIRFILSRRVDALIRRMKSSTERRLLLTALEIRET